MPLRLHLPLSLAALLLAVGACGSQIGDRCRTNTDCSPLGERFCDLSAPGGYCTIEGCDINSCPNGSVCIRFFQPDPDKPCTPLTAAVDCAANERCLCDCGPPDAAGNCPPEVMVASGSDGGFVLRCGTDGTLVEKPAHCAPEASERRWCQQRCKSDRDCRRDTNEDGERLYECRQTGTQGSEPIPERVNDSGIPEGEAARFCAQRAL